MAHGMCDSGGAAETRPDTGIVSAGPIVTSASVSPTNACGCNSELSVLITSDYGSLSYLGSGVGSSCSCCGIFLWIDQGDGDAKAQFFDRLTIASATLPAGTPVTVRANLSLVGGHVASNSASFPPTESSFSARLDVTGPVGRFLSINDTQGTTNDEFTLVVGQSFDIRGRLDSLLRDRVLQGLNQTGSFEASLNAVVWFDVLTAGAGLTSCSGHDYAPVIACIADVDDGTGTGSPDGGVTIDDLLYYIQIFNQGLVAADVDDGSGTGTHDGGVTIDDLLYYLVRFNAGC
ncbi:MAG: GC-type dockerin domain-anchored protein [Phycisphaerales bacterium]